MSDLQNLTPANTYKGLLQVGDYTNGVDSTVKAVLDGEGTTSALAIGTTKVGINTTSPTQELDVNGDIVSTTLTTSGAVTAGSVSTSGAVTAGSLDVSGNVVADEYALDQTGTSSSAVAIHAPATNEIAIRTNSTEAMRIDSSGKVGIGVTDPSAKMDIKDGHILVKQSTNTTQENILLQGSGYELNGTLYGNVSIRSNYNNSTNAATLNFYSASSSTNTTERMRIDSEGRVGIGTTSPSGKLTVLTSSENTGINYGNLADSLLIENTSDAAGAGPKIVFYNRPNEGNGTPSALIGLMRETATDASTTGDNKGSLVFLTRGAVNPEQRMIIDSDGNVGIGTVSPSAPLDVSSTTGGVIMPRMTTTQRTAISSPTPGEMVYDTDLNKFYGYTSSGWTALH